MTNKIPLGLCWAKPKWNNNAWDLVEVRKESKKIKIYYVMGWECSSSVEEYTYFVKANLKDPDGNAYDFSWPTIE